jgi:hypothetical protein
VICSPLRIFAIKVLIVIFRRGAASLRGAASAMAILP